MGADLFFNLNPNQSLTDFLYSLSAVMSTEDIKRSRTKAKYSRNVKNIFKKKNDQI